MAGRIYLVATPIGNLSDMTFRAIDTLKKVDLIAAEDTRQTLKLLNHFEISKPMISYHRHNEDIKSECLIEKVLAGKNIAIVTDAGTPGISDPGEEIVKEAIKNNIDIIPIPGACAFVNSLIVSGISTTEFSFYGFLPLNKKNRKEKLLQIMKDQKTVILYEAPHKLLKTLEDILENIGDVQGCLVRELTKIHEQKIYGTISELINLSPEPKGEYVIVLDLNTNENSDDVDFSKMSLEEHYNFYEKLGLDKKEIIKQIAKDRNVNKNEIYQSFILFFIYSASFISDIFSKHLSQTNFPLYSTNFFELPQNIQFDSNFFNIMLEPSTYISIGSFSAIPNLFLNSIGITTLPNSSTLLTIPVDFIQHLLKITFFDKFITIR